MLLRNTTLLTREPRETRRSCRHGGTSTSRLLWSAGTSALIHLLLSGQRAQDQIRPQAHTDLRQDLDFVTKGRISLHET